MDKHEFCKYHVVGKPRQAMAMAVLPDGDRPLEDWEQLFDKVLKQKVN
jgi:hypothetical protein